MKPANTNLDSVPEIFMQAGAHITKIIVIFFLNRLYYICAYAHSSLRIYFIK